MLIFIPSTLSTHSKSHRAVFQKRNQRAAQHLSLASYGPQYSDPNPHLGSAAPCLTPSLHALQSHHRPTPQVHCPRQGSWAPPLSLDSPELGSKLSLPEPHRPGLEGPERAAPSPPSAADILPTWLTLAHPLGIAFSVTSSKNSPNPWAGSSGSLFPLMVHCSFPSNIPRSL